MWRLRQNNNNSSGNNSHDSSSMGPTGSSRPKESNGRKGFMRSTSRSQTPVMTVKMPVRVASRSNFIDSDSSDEEEVHNPLSHIFALRKHLPSMQKKPAKKVQDSDSEGGDDEKPSFAFKKRVSTTSTGLDTAAADTGKQDMQPMPSSRSCLSSNSSRSNPSLPGQPSQRRISWAHDLPDDELPDIPSGIAHKVINEGLATDLAGLPPVPNYSLAGKPRRRKARGSMLAVNSDSVAIEPPAKRIPQDWAHLLEDLEENSERRRNSGPSPPPHAGLVGLDVDLHSADTEAPSSRGRRMGATSSGGSSGSSNMSPMGSRRSSGAGEAMDARDSARKAPMKPETISSGNDLTGLASLVVTSRARNNINRREPKRNLQPPTAASAPSLAPPTLFDDDMRPMVSTGSRTSTAWQERDQEKVITHGSGALAAMQRAKDGNKRVAGHQKIKKSRLTMFGLMYG